jgi:ribosomal protein L16 Arg81 hydroxylase
VPDERDHQRQLEWALVVQALNDNSLAVVRAMRRFRSETEQEQVDRVLTSYEDGSFLVDRLVLLRHNDG